MKGFPVGCWYATSGDCRAVTDPAWTGGPHPCDVGSWHTRQRFAKPLYAPGHWSLILFILPHLCVSVSTKQVCLSVIINVQHRIFIHFLPVLTGVSPNPNKRMLHLMLLQEDVTVGAEKKRSSSALAFNSVVSPIVLGLGQATDAFPIKRQI